MLEHPIVQLLILVASLAGLTAASHYAIRFVERLIELTRLSDMSAGFVVLSVLTSIPEITVAIFAVLQGAPAVSVGDILGSNMFNVGVVLGVLGVLGYLATCCTDLLVELTDILFITTLIPLLLVISHLHIFDVSSPVVGGILLAAFAVNTLLMSRKRTPPIKADRRGEKTGVKPVVGILLGSFAAVLVSARFVVYSASNIALTLGMPQILVGAVLVAVGTSLPELTTALVAARRGRVQLAIGDVIGSNLTNLTLVLGLVLLTSPFRVDMTVFTEIFPFLIVSTIIFWRFLMRGGISKVEGAALLSTYILFQAIITQA